MPIDASLAGEQIHMWLLATLIFKSTMRVIDNFMAARHSIQAASNDAEQSFSFHDIMALCTLMPTPCHIPLEKGRRHMTALGRERWMLNILRVSYKRMKPPPSAGISPRHAVTALAHAGRLPYCA